jgi:HIP---CoA ligase
MRADLRYKSIGALVRSAGEQYGHNEALIDGDRTWTYAELASDIERAAAAFLASGIEPGDRVAIWAPNIWEWIVCALGAVTAGASLVPLNTRFKGNEAADILTRSRARILCTVNGFLGTDYVAALHSVSDGIPSTLERIVVLRGETGEGSQSWEEFLSAGDSVNAAAVSTRLNQIVGSDPCDIIFTSGTTGRPKGVVTTHAQTLRMFEMWADVVGLRASDRYLIVNPFFHTFGYKSGVLACFLTGAVMIPQPIFDVDAVLQMVEKHRVSMLPGPPTLHQSILDHPRRSEFDLSSLRLAVTGAAAIPVTMIERMQSELTFRTIVTGYGLTEATGVVTMCRHNDDPVTIATTSGRAAPGVEVKLVSHDGSDTPTGSPGEIWVRGYGVMNGYFEDPAATAEAIDAEGWLHTGDIGVMNEAGYVRITDRVKDMFIVGGFNAYPAEIENALLRHPAIAQAAVVGTPNERLGEVGVAFVVLRPGAVVNESELTIWAREEMANYKVPRTITIVDVLPTNASGKVLKYELRIRAIQGESWSEQLVVIAETRSGTVLSPNLSTNP